jgi:hypothetical protein
MPFEPLRQLIDVIRRNPGLNAIDLRKRAPRAVTIGTLRKAELAGHIQWKNGGWHLAETPVTGADTP